MIPAVILAAGGSARMGRPKALLPAPPAGRPFLARIAGELAAGGAGPIVVVAADTLEAAFRAALASSLSGIDVRFVRNPDPSRGPLSSLWTGMDAAVTRETPALLMTPVDVPMVTAAVVARVIDTWRLTGAPVVRPALGDRHGHPVLFDRAVFDELRRAPLARGAKHVVRAHAAEVIDVAVEDEGCLIDVDTPAEYDALMKRA